MAILILPWDKQGGVSQREEGGEHHPPSPGHLLSSHPKLRVCMTGCRGHLCAAADPEGSGMGQRPAFKSHLGGANKRHCVVTWRPPMTPRRTRPWGTEAGRREKARTGGKGDGTGTNARNSDNGRRLTPAGAQPTTVGRLLAVAKERPLTLDSGPAAKRQWTRWGRGGGGGGLKQCHGLVGHD